VSTAKFGHCICFAIPQISNWNIEKKQVKHNREKDQAKVTSKYNSKQTKPSDDCLTQYSSAQSDQPWPDYSNKWTKTKKVNILEKGIFKLQTKVA
jgi:hypothetical protein